MRTIWLAALAATAMALPAAAYGQSAKEVQKDQRTVAKDQRKLDHDLASGDFKKADKHIRDVAQDRKELTDDWIDYRRKHGDTFRRGDYRGPAGYRYRGLAVGYRLAPAYYGRSYWVDDLGATISPRRGPASGGSATATTSCW